MSLKVPPSDPSQTGIPGLVKKVEWGEWETSGKKDGIKRKKVGVKVTVDGWEHPIHWPVSFAAKGGYDPNCSGSKAMNALVKLGLTSLQSIKNGDFDWAIMEGHRFLFGSVQPWEGLDTSIRLPVALLDGDAEEPEAHVDGNAASPEDVVLAAIRGKPGMTTEALVQVLLTGGREAAVEWWFSSGREKLVGSSVEVRDGGLFAKEAVVPVAK